MTSLASTLTVSGLALAESLGFTLVGVLGDVDGVGLPLGCTMIAMMIVIAVSPRATMTAIQGQTTGGFGVGAVSVVMTVVLVVTGAGC
jgi:hypothetical protein